MHEKVFEKKLNAFIQTHEVTRITYRKILALASHISEAIYVNIIYHGS